MKVSLPLAPALAACGLKVPMISGRGLGHTGGTLDKLESIPGFTVEQSPAQMQELLSSVGCCIVGQTATLVPGDRILYSVRDVTSTVDSIPLITASIVSKKVAEGLNDLVLDVKVGRAAFMKTEEEARELAKSMVDAGNGANVKTRALLTSMDHPIGNMIGNALEIIESVETLQGKGPEDLLELVTTLGGELLFANGKATSEAAGAEMILNALNDGTALAKFKGMIIKQGVEPELAEKLCSDPSSTLQKADIVTDIPALTSGFVHDIDAMGLAVFAGRMGAGRQVGREQHPVDSPLNSQVQTDKIQFEVGLQLKCCVGTEVSEGQSLVAVHHKKPLSEEQVATLQQCFTVKAEKITKRSRIIDVIS